jgi:hypothetical protein
MNGHAVCTLPAPAKPLKRNAPKVCGITDIDQFVGNGVWAYNGATPLDDADR